MDFAALMAKRSPSQNLESVERPNSWTKSRQNKVLRVFLLAIHSHHYSFALRFIFLQTPATSYSLYSSATVHCKVEWRKTIENHTPFHWYCDKA
jgi:hypothetical protein